MFQNSKICGTKYAMLAENYDFDTVKVEMITLIYDSMSDN